MLKLLTLFCLLSVFIFAADKATKSEVSNDEDLIITSQHLDYNHEKLKAHFTIDVKAINGETILTADEMTCFFDKNNDPYLIIAEGSVVITRDKTIAKAEKATYKIKEETIILRSNPELFDGKNTIKGRIITYYQDKRITDVVDADVLFKADIKTEEKKNEEKKNEEKKNEEKAED